MKISTLFYILFVILILNDSLCVKLGSSKIRMKSKEKEDIHQDEINDQFLDEDLAQYLESNDNEEDDEDDEDFMRENSEEHEHDNENGDPFGMDSFDFNDNIDYDDFTGSR